MSVVMKKDCVGESVDAEAGRATESVGRSCDGLQIVVRRLHTTRQLLLLLLLVVALMMMACAPSRHRVAYVLPVRPTCPQHVGGVHRRKCFSGSENFQSCLYSASWVAVNCCCCCCEMTTTTMMMMMMMMMRNVQFSRPKPRFPSRSVSRCLADRAQGHRPPRRHQALVSMSTCGSRFPRRHDARRRVIFNLCTQHQLTGSDPAERANSCDQSKYWPGRVALVLFAVSERQRRR